MIPKRGFFQPLEITGQIGWLWWGIALLAGLITWSELSFQLVLPVIGYLTIVLLLGLILILRRRVYIVGPRLFLGHVLTSEYEEISLVKVENWQLNGHVLQFTRAGRDRKYWLSKNITQQIKDYMNTHDGQNHN
ncbi:EbsA family protein [Leuconostoc lactis]|uniref:EbsA family protein n=1 Tax=Leuconostoc lactis TaxID=1246 RepID=UPI00020DA121|nr:EbsA family protein [Leuconostoc lactis]